MVSYDLFFIKTIDINSDIAYYKTLTWFYNVSDKRLYYTDIDLDIIYIITPVTSNKSFLDINNQINYMKGVPLSLIPETDNSKYIINNLDLKIASCLLYKLTNAKRTLI
jgi:hypothetical protein